MISDLIPSKELPNDIWLTRFLSISLFTILLLGIFYFLFTNVEIRFWFSIRKVRHQQKRKNDEIR